VGREILEGISGFVVGNQDLQEGMATVLVKELLE